MRAALRGGEKEGICECQKQVDGVEDSAARARRTTEREGARARARARARERERERGLLTINR